MSEVGGGRAVDVFCRVGPGEYKIMAALNNSEVFDGFRNSDEWGEGRAFSAACGK